MIKIVRVSPGDWKQIRPAILVIEQEIFDGEAFEEQAFNTFKNPKAYNLIVVDQKGTKAKIVGYLMSQKLSYSEYHGGMQNRNKTFYLESIGLLDKYRGKGIGKELFHKYMMHGIGLGCDRFILETAEIAMMNLAESHGFKKIRYYPKHFATRGAWLLERIGKERILLHRSRFG